MTVFITVQKDRSSAMNVHFSEEAVDKEMRQSQQFHGVCSINKIYLSNSIVADICKQTLKSMERKELEMGKADIEQYLKTIVL